MAAPPAKADTVYTFDGTLKGSDGRALPNFSMTLTSADESFYSSFSTDAAGAFSAEIFADTYKLSISGGDQDSAISPSIDSIITRGMVFTGNTTMNLVVPIKTLALTVHDSSGQPVPNAAVIINGDGSYSSPFALYSGGINVDQTYIWRTVRYTDAAGNVTMPVMPGSAIPVVIAPDPSSNLPSSTVSMNLLADTTTTVTLLPAFPVTGTLKDSSGNPLANYRVSLLDRAGGLQANLSSDANGDFSAYVSAGTYAVTVEGGDDSSGSAPRIDSLTAQGLAVNGAVALNLVIPLRTLTLTVTGADSLPLANASIIIIGDASMSPAFALYGGGNNVDATYTWRSTRLTDAAGTVTVPVMPGSAIPVIIAPDAATGMPTATVSENTLTDTATTVTLPAVYSVSGTLKTDDGAVMSGYNIHFDDRTDRRYKYFVTDADGAFSGKAYAGTYELSIDGGDPNSGATPMINSLIVNGLTISADSTLAMTVPVNYLTLTAVDFSGAPVANATVNIQSDGLSTTPFTLYPGGDKSNQSTSWTIIRTTDANGQATIPFIPSKKVVVWVTPQAQSGLNNKSVTYNLNNDVSKTITFRKNIRALIKSLLQSLFN